MRTNEERILAMHRRANELKNSARARAAKIMMAVSAAAGLAAAVLLAIFMPGFSERMISGNHISAWMNASIFSNNSSIGYIIIALVAFLLGVTVTLFCLCLKKWKDKDGDGIS